MFKKEIIKSLNILFNNDDELRNFCNMLSNDVELIVDKINKIIKYSFVNDKFVFGYKTLCSYLYEIDNVDDEYKEYLKVSSKGFFSFLRKKEKCKNNFTIPLDDDIKLSDLDDLKLPSLNEIKDICASNISIQEEKEERQKKNEVYYKEQRGFDEVGFTYERLDMITIDSSFVYYHDSLSGNVYEDFDVLYNDDRYGGTFVSFDPLKESYETNIERIKQLKDIKLTKMGNVYQIDNGRHRILYILRNGGTITMPAYISRRIEDREFNVILNSLRKKYNIMVCKNNLLNDEPNVLLVLDGKAYEIKSKEELINFYNNIKAEKNNANFNIISFSDESNINEREIVAKYKNLIFKKYLEIGEEILTSNFTEIIKYFDNVNNVLFYRAFILIQTSYQESVIFKYDFKRSYKMFENDSYCDDKSDKISKSK